uniref:Uncharacterized protein n=1 Tax=Octopus bimaculoides TaxID=37653 RepID=A0A0L8I5H9_OCTBM
MLAWVGQFDQGCVLIGAPKDNYDKCKNSEFSKTGVVFSCSSSTDDSCSKFCIHNLESSIDEDIQNVSNAWLGVSIDINPHKEEFVTCGHRWKSSVVDDSYLKTLYMKGFCVVNTFNDPKDRRLLFMKSDNITAGGTSVKYTQDGQNIIVGVLGRDRYPGGIILFPNKGETPAGKPLLLQSDIDNNYAGYAVSSGKFFNDKYEYYVMGVPRDGSGAVLITDKNNHIVQRLQSESKEIGSYFGMKLCVADVNKDGLDDLLVGAPMEPGQSREEGQVIVYLSDGKKLQKKLVLFGDKEEGGRFGSAMTSIGDINQDGFIDIAIGAPYENKLEGAIYIYNTNKEGLPSTYSQKITGKDAAMGKDMKGFGISISDSVDVNKDNCPDFLVGAYLSDQVRLLFSRPVLDLNLELLPESQKINFTKYNCPSHGNKAVCFKVKLKFSYVQNNKQIPPRIDLEGQLATGSQPQMNLSHSVQSFGFKLESGKKSEKEFQIIVKEHPNIFQPIHITIKMALAKNTTCQICPILRTQTFVKKIPFELECGDDDKCTTDLKVSASTSLKYLLYQKEEKFDINVIVSNGINHAYNSFATFIFPQYLQYIQAIKTKVQPGFECSTDSSLEEDMVRCTLGNPLPKNTVSTFALRFSSTGRIDQPENAINISVKTKSFETPQDLKNNKMTINIPNRMKAFTDFYGNSNPDLLSSETKNITVTHVLAVYNHGPSPLFGVTLNVTLPSLLRDKPDLIQRICKNPSCPTSFHLGNISKGFNRQIDIVFSVNEKIHSVKKDLKYLETKAVLARKDHRLYIPDKNQWPWKISVQTVFQVEAEPIAWWIILLCILGGILILALCIVLFWWLGFFKRNKVNRDEDEKSFVASEKLSNEPEENNVEPEKKTNADDNFL